MSSFKRKAKRRPKKASLVPWVTEIAKDFIYADQAALQEQVELHKARAFARAPEVELDGIMARIFALLENGRKRREEEMKDGN